MNRYDFRQTSALFFAAGALALVLSGCSCGDTATTARGKQLGDLCELDTECESGLCDAIPGGQKVCLKPCSHGCDYENGEICTTLGASAEKARQACVPDKGGLCNQCETSADCPYPADACVEVDGRKVCARDCSFDGAPCPGGYVCATATDVDGLAAGRQCMPKTGSCDCMPQTAGQTRSCTITNAFGKCGGMEKCDPDRGFIGCDAKVPQAEKCNLLDDNCDGRVDEDSETAQNPAAGIPPKTCGKGSCFRSVPGCIEGQEQSCVAGEPTDEICNGLDDNCNGTIDEPFTDLGQACSNGLGVCQRAGVMVCTADGSATACGAVPAPPGVEVCNKLDDDCNGSIDDMGTVSCGVGICKNTIVKCQDGTEPACVPLDGNKRTETCNELDDDCDGVVDNGFNLQNDLANCGKCGTVCSVRNGTPDCDSGQCVVQSCNVSQGFDDCDKRYSTGCEQDIWSSLDHCGGCNKLCAFANASARCTGGACSIGPCNPGWYDANENPADGCEYQCTFLSATDTPDDGFVDANCDGIDGELNNAIFVDCGAGNDGNPGTRALPVKTLTRALQSSSASGRNQILVANALCNESITLKEGVGLYGGYNNQTWARSFANLPIIQPNSSATPAVTGTGILAATAFDAFVVTAPAGISPSGSSIAMQLVNSNGVRISNSDLRAAAGAPGPDGLNGVNGGNGSVGQDGKPGGDGTSNGGEGGVGGTSACGSGGTGGRGGYGPQDGFSGGGGSRGACAGSGGI
ncbi:MAG: MopE-related protein, partial [Myxococcales bacterium]